MAKEWSEQDAVLGELVGGVELLYQRGPNQSGLEGRNPGIGTWVEAQGKTNKDGVRQCDESMQPLATLFPEKYYSQMIGPTFQTASVWNLRTKSRRKNLLPRPSPM